MLTGGSPRKSQRRKRSSANLHDPSVNLPHSEHLSICTYNVIAYTFAKVTASRSELPSLQNRLELTEQQLHGLLDVYFEMLAAEAVLNDGFEDVEGWLVVLDVMFVEGQHDAAGIFNGNIVHPMGHLPGQYGKCYHLGMLEGIQGVLLLPDSPIRLRLLSILKGVFLHSFTGVGISPFDWDLGLRTDEPVGD
jgi:hypothetical protein